ncbi:unnamed protein product [Cuscuta epithymum]|uniref:Uncharacterized protein n=1 Tax=Cuscuta epithymum TaxID=186058 RepID=A0AAV0FZZ8_9ASTE|nr:unnamed protein product [Cuscuta epithymum]
MCKYLCDRDAVSSLKEEEQPPVRAEPTSISPEKKTQLHAGLVHLYVAELEPTKTLETEIRSRSAVAVRVDSFALEGKESIVAGPSSRLAGRIRSSFTKGAGEPVVSPE